MNADQTRLTARATPSNAPPALGGAPYGVKNTDERASRRRWLIVHFPRALLFVLIANTVIAVLLAALLRDRFLTALIHTQIIGLSIFLLAWTFHFLRKGGTSAWWASLAAILLGGSIGTLSNRFRQSGDLWTSLWESPHPLIISIVGVLVFGTAMSYYFHSQARFARGRAWLREERLLRLENEQRLTEAELKLLQAQIEPHFLFNTLSNVVQLVDSDPPGAKRMLLNLTSYLRASLRRIRSGDTTLDEEFELVRAYLEIQAVRMGSRLSYELDCPPELRDLSLPPLLLQPLVENAVSHGVAPLPGGGQIRVRAERQGEFLLLEVSDTGVGFSAESPAGVGLTNVRERIRVISQGSGSLAIQPNTPRGLNVRILLPLNRESSLPDPKATEGRT